MIAISLTFCLSLYLSFSHFLSFSLSLSLTFCLYFSFSHFLSFSLSLSLTHFLSLSLSLTVCLSLSLTICLSLSLTSCLSLSLSLSMIVMVIVHREMYRSRSIQRNSNLQPRLRFRTFGKTYLKLIHFGRVCAVFRKLM